MLVRIDRLAADNPGDAKSIGGGVFELRINYGPGYRVYFLRDGDHLVVLSAGGDKSSQRADITTARAIAEAWRGERGGSL